MKIRILSFVIPVLLLICFISLSGWQPRPGSGKEAQDTTKKASKKSANYSRKTIITIDENGEPHEQVIENFDGDEGLRKMLVPGFNFDFEMPNIPDFERFAMPAFPEGFSFENGFQFDSLDNFNFRFKEGDFEGLSENMALMKERFEAMGPGFRENMRQLEDQLRSMDLPRKLQLDGLNPGWQEDIGRLGETLQRDLGDLDLNLQGLNENLFNLDSDLKFMNGELKTFMDEAQLELIKDGYLKADEKIETMEWTDESIKFNNIKIKSEHLEKYRALKNNHVKHQWKRGRPE